MAPTCVAMVIIVDDVVLESAYCTMFTLYVGKQTAKSSQTARKT